MNVTIKKQYLFESNSIHLFSHTHILFNSSLIQFLCKNTRDNNKETKILKTLDLLELPCREVIELD